MAQPQDVEERLRRHARAFTRDFAPPVDLHRSLMARVESGPAAQPRRPVLRELAIAAAVLLFIGLLALGFSRLRTLTQPQAAQQGRMTPVAASPIPWIDATPSPMLHSIPNLQTVSQAQVAQVLIAQFAGASPVLLPAYIPTGLSATVNASNNGYFDVTYTAQSSERQLHLAIVVANPPPPGPHGAQSMPRFRGDPRALYQVDDQTMARSDRFLMWTEPGIWSTGLLKDPGVPYFLSASGFTDAEFWRVANSLQVIISARPCTSADLTGRFAGANRLGSQLRITLFLRNHTSNGCSLQGVPSVALVTADGATNNLPNAVIDQAGTGPVLLSPNPALTIEAGQLYVSFSPPPCANGHAASPVRAVHFTLPGWTAPVILSATGPTPFSIADCSAGTGTGSVDIGSVSVLPPTVKGRAAPAMQLEVRAPGTAGIGRSLTYVVILTDVATRPFVFDGCPSYTETLGAEQPTIAQYVLNCGPAGVFLPGASYVFTMRLQVPANAAAGASLLSWQLDGAYGDVNGGVGITLTR